MIAAALDPRPRLNIVHICDHLGWEGSRMHGVKRLFAWMIPRFDRDRFNVSLISLRRKDLSEDTLEQFGIDVTYLARHKFDPGTYAALKKVLESKNADVLHMHGYGATTFGRLCARSMGLGSILHEHANHGETPGFQKIADRFLAKHTDLAIAVSASTAEFTIRARLMPAERTRVVYLGAPLDEFARSRSPQEIAGARAALGIAPETIAVGTVTRLMPSKGNQYLVDAAAALAAKYSRLRVYIVGEGELRGELEAQAKALRLGDRLVFAGFQRDVAAVLSALDIVVFPSLWEGTPLTAFEALAAGKPIVASDADGLRDILTDRHDALVVPKRDAAALTRAIDELLDQPADARKLAENARRCAAGGSEFSRRARMTTDQDTRDLGWQLGVGATLGLGVVLLGWALSVNVPKVTGGFFSDFSTYYSMTHSLADDFDFEYRREDLMRVWREYPTGPEGIFLKRGRDVQGLRVRSTPPFFELVSGDDWDPNRLYYAKSFIFPLFAAPFVWLFGTKGFFVLHALLLTACFACAYGFLVARSAPVPSLIFAMAFLFASVVPVYLVQYMPDFFNLAMVLIAYFFWAYKEAAAESTTVCIGRFRQRWILSPRSDLVAAVLLGVATFSKPTLVFVIAPMLVLFSMRRQWRRAMLASVAFAAVVVGLFAANAGITGDWNYQGGDRRIFTAAPSVPGSKGGFPFQSESHTFDAAGVSRTTNSVPIEVLTGRDAFFEVFRRNLGYFFFGRHTGFVPYFFPGAAAMLLFLFSRRHPRRLWQWATLATAIGSAVFLLLYMPFTYSGGGGPVGNRYFLGVYPLFLFVTPPLMRLTGPLAAAGIGALFTAQVVMNPFYATYHPGDHAKGGLYRVLPIELTLLNDLPVNNDPPRVKRPLGGQPPVYAYFIDDNAYNPESDAFWVKGESRADVLLRAPVRTEGQSEGEIVRPLTMPRAVLELETGPVPNRVTITTGADTQVVDLPANNKRLVTVAFPQGVPYKPMPDLPTNYIYAMSITSETSFIPMFQVGPYDPRYLGVYVRVTPLYE